MSYFHCHLLIFPSPLSSIIKYEASWDWREGEKISVPSSVSDSAVIDSDVWACGVGFVNWFGTFLSGKIQLKKGGEGFWDHPCKLIDECDRATNFRIFNFWGLLRICAFSGKCISQYASVFVISLDWFRMHIFLLYSQFDYGGYLWKKNPFDYCPILMPAYFTAFAPQSRPPTTFSGDFRGKRRKKWFFA